MISALANILLKPDVPQNQPSPQRRTLSLGHDDWAVWEPIAGDSEMTPAVWKKAATIHGMVTALTIIHCNSVPADISPLALLYHLSKGNINLLNRDVVSRFAPGLNDAISSHRDGTPAPFLQLLSIWNGIPVRL